MSLSRLRSFALVTIIGLFAAALQAQPLPSDPNNVTGTLKNGVSYIFRQHSNPPEKLAMAIHVRTGSINEDESQRGLAHFTEHMAFNGSDNFAPGDLVPFFESIGLQWGMDLNAFTGFDMTCYTLFSLPDCTDENVDKGMMLLSDYAFRLSFLPEEIESERKVIMEEKNYRLGPDRRIRDQIYKRLFAGSRVAERMPIGIEDVILHAPQERFLDYYKTWYRPENVTLILVGDTEFDKVKPYIEKWFSQKVDNKPAKPPYKPELVPFTQQRAVVVTDPEITGVDISALNLKPDQPTPTTVEQRRDGLVIDLATWIVDRRLSNRIKQGKASYRGAGTGVGDILNDGTFVSASANGDPEDWEKILDELIIEVSRARLYGFLESEFELAKKQFKAIAELAVKQEATRNGAGIARGMLFQVHDKMPMLSAQQELDLLNKLLPTIKLSELEKAFADNFKPGTYAYCVEIPEKEGVVVPAEEQVLAAARAALAKKVEPMKEDAVTKTLLEKKPTPGKVVDKTVDKDLDITSICLDNNVRLHHREMDYKKNTVFCQIVLAGGQIEETPANVYITQAAALAFADQKATSRLSSTDINDLMTGKNISVAGGASGDTFVLNVTGDPADFETGLQLAHALLTDGKIEQTAFDNWKKNVGLDIEKSPFDFRFQFQKGLFDIVSDGDIRFHPLPTTQRLEAITIKEAQAWYDRLRQTAPIEIAIVGDLPYDKAEALVTQYFGSLAKRSRNADHLDKLRTITVKPGAAVKHVELPTITPQAITVAGFRGTDRTNVDDARLLSLASMIIQTRTNKIIREEKGLVYSAFAQSSPAQIYRNAGFFIVIAPCSPENKNIVPEEAFKILTDFAKNGPTDEELSNAKKQILNILNDQIKEPSTWLRKLATADLHELDLAKFKTIKEDYQNYTHNQMMTAFNKYYTPDTKLTVTVAPAPAETATLEEAKEEATAEVN